MNETCHSTQSVLPWLVTGKLPSDQTVAAFHHVRTCPSCQRELAFLVSTKQSVDEVWGAPPSTAFTESLLAAVADELSEYEEGVSQEEVWLDILAVSLARGLSPFSFVYDTLGYAVRVVTGRVKHVLSGLI